MRYMAFNQYLSRLWTETLQQFVAFRSRGSLQMSPLMTYLESLNDYICKQVVDYIQSSGRLSDLV